MRVALTTVKRLPNSSTLTVTMRVKQAKCIAAGMSSAF